MKYVMLSIELADVRRDMPVMFPDFICHDEMALWYGEALKSTFGEDLKVEAVSAGFCDLRVNTSGSSETLGLHSRPKDDSIINTFDYFGGIS